MYTLTILNGNIKLDDKGRECSDTNSVIQLWLTARNGKYYFWISIEAKTKNGYSRKAVIVLWTETNKY